MKALTIDAIWAWAIVSGRKPVENRSWITGYRGPLAIHAGRNTARDAEARSHLERIGITNAPTNSRIELLRGNLIGIVELADIREVAQLPSELRGNSFVEGPYCWILRNPRWLLERVPCSGRQGIWEIPAGHSGSIEAVVQIAKSISNAGRI